VYPGHLHHHKPYPPHHHHSIPPFLHPCSIDLSSVDITPPVDCIVVGACNARHSSPPPPPHRCTSTQFRVVLIRCSSSTSRVEIFFVTIASSSSPPSFVFLSFRCRLYPIQMSRWGLVTALIVRSMETGKGMGRVTATGFTSVHSKIDCPSLGRAPPSLACSSAPLLLLLLLLLSLPHPSPHPLSCPTLTHHPLPPPPSPPRLPLFLLLPSLFSSPLLSLTSRLLLVWFGRSCVSCTLLSGWL
jgi:hypothetical protein